MTDPEILSILRKTYGSCISDNSPFPEAYCKDLGQVKAIYLGCDPSNQDNRYRFKYAFTLEGIEDPDITYFKAFRTFHTNNLQEVGLTWNDLYVQNLCRNYFAKQTSEHFPFWKQLAREFWVDQLKQELTIFPDSIPVLLTSSYLYQVLVTGDWAHHTAPEFYQCKIPIPVPAEMNLLKRPLIPFYRGRSPLLKKSYYLKGQWEEYKQSIRKVISP